MLYIKEEQLQLLFELEALSKMAYRFDLEEKLMDVIAVLCGHIEAFPECWYECQAVAQHRVGKRERHPLSPVWHLLAELQQEEYSL